MSSRPKAWCLPATPTSVVQSRGLQARSSLPAAIIIATEPLRASCERTACPRDMAPVISGSGSIISACPPTGACCLGACATTRAQPEGHQLRPAAEMLKVFPQLTMQPSTTSGAVHRDQYQSYSAVRPRLAQHLLCTGFFRPRACAQPHGGNSAGGCDCRRYRSASMCSQRSPSAAAGRPLVCESGACAGHALLPSEGSAITSMPHRGRSRERQCQTTPCRKLKPICRICESYWMPFTGNRYFQSTPAPDHRGRGYVLLDARRPQAARRRCRAVVLQCRPLPPENCRGDPATGGNARLFDGVSARSSHWRLNWPTS